MIVAQIFQDGGSSTHSERRLFQRLSIAVQTELHVRGNETPIRVETADISLGGCYIEMALTLPVGTPLDIVLWLGDEKLAVSGRVVTCHPQFGNGIQFTDMDSDSQRRLECFLERAPIEDNQTSERRRQ